MNKLSDRVNLKYRNGYLLNGHPIKLEELRPVYQQLIKARKEGITL